MLVVELLEDDIPVESRLLLQLGDYVASSYASTHVHGHAHSSEQRGLNSNDVMSLHEGGGEQEEVGGEERKWKGEREKEEEVKL